MFEKLVNAVMNPVTGKIEYKAVDDTRPVFGEKQKNRQSIEDLKETLRPKLMFIAQFASVGIIENKVILILVADFLDIYADLGFIQKLLHRSDFSKILMEMMLIHQALREEAYKGVEASIYWEYALFQALDEFATDYIDKYCPGIYADYQQGSSRL